MILNTLITLLVFSLAAPIGATAIGHSYNLGEGVLAKCSATGSSAVAVTTVPRPSKSIADNSVVIQKAIDRAAQSGGAIVQLPKGKFSLDRPLIVKDNVELRGEGAATVLKASTRFLESRGPYGGHPLITTSGARNVTISRLTADHSGDLWKANSIDGRLNEYLIDVRHSENAVVENVITKNPFTYSIAVVGSSRFCVRSSQTTAATSGRYDQLDGIHVLGSHDGLVAGNYVDQGRGTDGDDGLAAHTMGETVHDIEFLNNTVRGGRHGAAMQLALGEKHIYNITVRNNLFWGSPVGVHTGYYGGDAPICNVVVSGNTFVDIPGPSVDLFGRLSGVSVTGNKRIRSGDTRVDPGMGNRISGNLHSC